MASKAKDVLSVRLSLLVVFVVSSLASIWRTSSILTPLKQNDDHDLLQDRANSELVIDVLSVGSQTRLSLLEAQKQTLASHVNVRNFFAVTEKDDIEPDCAQQLSDLEAVRIAGFCKSRKYQPNSLMDFFKKIYFSPTSLQRRPSPAGWLCAQKRPLQGIIKVFDYYKNSELPDYLIIIDDDTFFDIETFVQNYNKTMHPIVTAGCRMRFNTGKAPNFTFYFGGYGVWLTKASLERMRKPIFCPRDKELCDQIDANMIGEQFFFRQGSSVVDMIDRLQRRALFTKLRRWRQGYCFHSDWVLSYFVNWYSISMKDENRALYRHLHQERLHTFQNSEFRETRHGLKEFRGICSQVTSNFSASTCHENSPICHYMTVDDILNRTAAVKAASPASFREIEK